MNWRDAREWVDRAIRSFEKACIASGGSQDRHYRICGRDCLFRPAGSPLASLLAPALAHLECDVKAAGGANRFTPELTILAWDSASTGIPFDHPWRRRPPATPRDIIYHRQDGVRFLYNFAGGTLSFFDESRRIAGYWVDAADTLSFVECASPFRAVFQWWMRGWGGLLVHAAAAGLEDAGGVLIPGGEGAGKSTVAALCLRHGFRLAGDDYIGLTPNPAWRADSLYCSLKLTPESMAWMPDLAGLARQIGRSSTEKAVLYLAPAYRKALVSGLDLQAVLIPRVTGRDGTVIRPTSAAEGIRALAPSTLYVQVGERNGAFEFLSDFVRRVPCYVMELGRDLASVPPAIEDFIRRTC